MKEAIASGNVVVAGPNAPAVAVCPACGGKVFLRRRGDTGTWFYRHAAGEDPHCPRRQLWWRK